MIQMKKVPNVRPGGLLESGSLLFVTEKDSNESSTTTTTTKVEEI
jgi:hypothetical protein